MARSRPVVVSIAGAVAALAMPLRIASAQVPQAPRLTVTGVVYDSIAHAPLAAANVQLIRADSGLAERRAFFATSDARGRFRLDSVPPGAYLAGFFHPMLDSLGLQVPGRRVELRDGSPRVDFAIPSPARVAETVCGAKVPNDSAGTLIGFVRDAASGAPRGDGALTVRWLELVLERSGLQRAVPEVKTRTSAAGWFAVCNLPARTELMARASAGADTSGVVLVEVPGRGIAHTDLYVGRAEPAPPVASAASDSARSDTMAIDSLAGLASVSGPAPRRGPARLVGRVMGSTGQPLAGARVAVWETTAQAVTDDSGAFALSDLPAGSHTLDVRALGFMPAREAVNLRDAAEPTAATVSLLSVRASLDTIRVSTTRIFSRDRNGFDARRRRGVGNFMDRAQIERRVTASASNLLAPIPGVYVLPARYGPTVRMKDHWGNYCRPAIIIDRVRMPPEPLSMGETMPLDLLVQPDDIGQLEVYARDTEVPTEYQSLSGCGVIVIWTRPPDPASPKEKKQD